MWCSQCSRSPNAAKNADNATDVLITTMICTSTRKHACTCTKRDFHGCKTHKNQKLACTRGQCDPLIFPSLKKKISKEECLFSVISYHYNCSCPKGSHSYRGWFWCHNTCTIDICCTSRTFNWFSTSIRWNNCSIFRGCEKWSFCGTVWCKLALSFSSDYLNHK